jgi:hypothetical protein
MAAVTAYDRPDAVSDFHCYGTHQVVAFARLKRTRQKVMHCLFKLGRVRDVAAGGLASSLSRCIVDDLRDVDALTCSTAALFLVVARAAFRHPACPASVRACWNMAIRLNSTNPKSNRNRIGVTTAISTAVAPRREFSTRVG